MPGVDDGARDVEEAVAAVAGLRAEGVGTVVATPHLPASRTERPDVLLPRLEKMDRAFERLQEEVERRGLDVRLERGAEIRLNSPDADLSDPRLRLAGTHFVLVEFSAFRMPPFGDGQLEEIREAGWIPILAHPERYAGVGERLEVAAKWRERAFFQVNAGSLLGQYGPAARKAARAFLERGWVDYAASDYHARGQPGIEPLRRLLLEAEAIEEEESDRESAPASGANARAFPGGEPNASRLSVARLLTEVNPRRMMANREPLPVPGLALAAGVFDRLKGWFR